METEETGEEAPDLGGTYDSVISDETGCEGVLDELPFSGSLAVSGTPDALVFAWAAYDATGSVDDSFAVTLAESGAFDGEQLELEADGLATVDAGGAWVLDLGFAVDFVTTDTGGTGGCSATGTLTATQVSVR